MTTNPITVKNPYRKKSKLHDIFYFMADGEEHFLREITSEVYDLVIPAEGYYTLLQRRVASALRTIRRRSDVTIHFTDGIYLMTQYKTNARLEEFEV